MANWLARYEPDHIEFSKYMMSDDVAAVAHRAAAGIARAAVRLATGVSKTGNYAKGFRVDRDFRVVVINDGDGPGGRRISQVYNDDPAAAPLEFGNKNIKPQRILGRAAASIWDPSVRLKANLQSWGGDRGAGE